MKLRTQLVLSFVGVALFVLIFFGGVTYRIVTGSSYDRNTAIMGLFAEQEANELAARLDGNISEEGLGSLLAEHSTKELAAFIVNPAGEITPPRPIADIFDTRLGRIPFEEILTSDKPGGHHHAGNLHIDWYVAPIPSSPYKLILIGSLADNYVSPLETVGARLIVTGLIAIWVAVWGALIISAAIMKRLDKQNALLLHQETHDSLTGLPNRMLLNNRLQEYIEKNKDDKKPVSLFVMDLDHFKDINDTLGHDFGDRLLKTVGLRIQHVLRDYDTVARLGGDEFAAVLPNLDSAMASQCAMRVLEAMEDPFVMDGFDISIGGSIGIAVYPEHGDDVASLTRRADVAMYQAKQSNSGFAIYTLKSDPYNLRRLTLLADLCQAMERNQLLLHYQPKIDITTQKITGVEALLRWQHPQLGFISPDEFIPLAEQGSLIKSLTLWVLNAALRQQHAWRQMGITMNVAVNLSAKNLQDMKLPGQIAKLLAAWKTPTGHLELEITESAVMADHDKAMQILTMLHNMGVGLSIDDFGTGHSSLAYLKQLPVNTLKIDKTFVFDMCTNENDAIIVRTTIDLAHNLGMKVVAEGVETREALDLLQILGCDTAQGYYFSKPLPESELTLLLKNVSTFPASKKALAS